MSRSVSEWIAKHDDQTIPARVRARVFERYDGICQITHRKIRPGDQWDCDHEIALINGGEHRESNLVPVLRAPHREKTAEDVAQKRKNARVRKKHLGLHKSRNRLPGGKGSKFKKKLNGEVVER